MPGLTYAKDYQPIVYEWFNQAVLAVPSLIPELFNVQTITDLSAYTLGIGGIPVEAWNVYSKTGRAASVEPEKGYSETFTLVEYPVRLPIKKLYLQTDKTGLVMESIQEVAISAAQKRESDAASVFNYAWTSGHTGPDGYVLCYASHPSGPDNTGTTSDNTGTEAFSYTAVKNARKNMRAWTDGQKNPLRVKGSLVLLPIELEDQAIEIFGAIQTPGGVTYGGNATTGFQYRVWDELTDDESWWMLDPARAKRFLRWYNFGGYETMVVEETTTDIVYEFKMTYVFGWAHWSFVYGNTV